MAKQRHNNVFSKVYDTIGAFDDLLSFDKSDALTGSFKVKRKRNKKGISNIKATFAFDSESVNNLGFRKVNFKDRITNSLFGDSLNPRTVKSGNRKFDYQDIDGAKLVELSVEGDFLKAFERGRRINGFFRVSLDDDFIAMSTGKKENFQANKILTADFETSFI